ncbi:Hsp90 co-chaperone Cdc37 [Pseudolycoriella hygida]|uniref:Hsp90 co-chaperone Cdc37 n=1 Tax=Pseudolycoriella hygida TaxID=35572 RepID=A0A9Q0MNY5_9DIPT|nr:Hsp90 co-chaperone Cdc37 [Pseudolycoriella hygida]
MVDYSKWKNIEISDDEDETHPNIDTPSLFRWRHQARTERMVEMEREKQTLMDEQKKVSDALKEVRQKVERNEGNVSELQKSLAELEAKSKALSLDEEKLKTKEKLAPWNVDTISKPGFAKTVINKKPEKENYANLSEEEKSAKMKKFVEVNEKLLKQYGMLRKFDDSKRFLTNNNQLVCEDTANYLVIWCLNLEMEGKSELMGHVAHQCICMQFILESAKQLDVDPRACVSTFFSRIQVADAEYKVQFDNEISAFKDRIKARAVVKLQEAAAEAEEEERLARLGPGGLDPAEVFETLPEVLQKCFESRDIAMLQEAITKLPEAEAKYHMKRCIDSGLWVPDANADKTTDDKSEDDELYEEAIDCEEPTVSSDSK